MTDQPACPAVSDAAAAWWAAAWTHPAVQHWTELDRQRATRAAALHDWFDGASDADGAAAIAAEIRELEDALGLASPPRRSKQLQAVREDPAPENRPRRPA